jgi:ferrous iron transport protein A
MTNLLKLLKRGDQARIVGFDIAGDPAYRARLLAMGLTRGTVFEVSRIAPLGDPIEIIIRGYTLSLRKTEAAILKIELIP